MKKINKCIICSKEGKIDFDLGDYYVRGCNDCQLQWVEETFEEKILEDFDYYWAREFFLQNEELLRTYARKELKNIERFVSPLLNPLPIPSPLVGEGQGEVREREGVRGKESPNWLDLGCGFAYLISEGKKEGFQVTGVEANQEIVNLAKNREPLNVIHSLINEVNFPEQSFDLVTLYDVLEHLLNPKEVISQASQWVKKNGLLIIEVPDGESFFRKIATLQFRLTFGKWKTLMRSAFHKHPGGHRYAFTEFSLSKLLNKFGFEIISAERVMMPFKLYLNEIIKDYRGLRKIVYIIFSVFFYYLSQISGMQHRLKIYARKT